jgi:hypothetical protein
MDVVELEIYVRLHLLIFSEFPSTRLTLRTPGRQSEVPFSQKLNTDGTPRRRSSVFSSLGSSPEGSGKRRFSWFGIRKESTAGEGDVKEEIEFRAVELGGRE